MQQFFPADVSLRVSGDLDAAQQLFPAARQLLFRALRRQELGGLSTVQMFMPMTDGSLISVFLSGPLKHLYVQPSVNRVAAVPRQQGVQEVEDAIPSSIYIMLSGAVLLNVVSPPQEPFIDATGLPPEERTCDNALYRFHPDSVCAMAYALEEAWAPVEKLAVNVDGSSDVGVPTSVYPKPSMFSGSMKRMVQALYGIGRTEVDDFEREYLTGDPPTKDAFDRINVAHNFDWHWVRTHGLTRVANGLWIVEISKLNGVVAMPMPVFAGTEGESYVRWLNSIGDTATATVAEEFGGLPTGEQFPTGTDLADALTNGKVIRLMTPEELEPFYHDATNDIDKFGLFAGCGWAFSESGVAAINTAFWYKDFAQAHPQVSYDQYNGDLPYPYTSLDPDDLYCRADYYRLDIELSSINYGTITAETPAGTGAATLTLVESRLTTAGGYDYRHYEFTWPNENQTPHIGFYDRGRFLRVPQDSNTATLEKVMLWGAGDEAFMRGATTEQVAALRLLSNQSDAVTYAFFVGETPELLRQNDSRTSIDGFYNFAILDGDSLKSTELLPRTLVPSGCCTAIPAGCREGYIFHWGVNQPSAPDTPGYAVGFFDDIGVVEFTPNEHLCIYFSASGTVAGYDWSPLTSFACAITVNCGVRPALVGHDGPCPLGLSGGVGQQFLDVTASLPDLEIPAQTNGTVITFVGAP